MKTNTKYAKALRDSHNAVDAAYAVMQVAEPFGPSPVFEAAGYALDVAEGVLDSVRALDIPLRA